VPHVLSSCVYLYIIYHDAWQIKGCSQFFCPACQVCTQGKNSQ
jgi:hypothetical protein